VRAKYPGQEYQLRLETDDRHMGALNRHVSRTDDADAFHPTACPICSDDLLEKIHRFTAKQAAEAFLPLHRDERRHRDLVHNIEYLWRGPICEVVQCGACRFTFPIPYVAGDQEFYELAYGLPSYPGHRWEYDRAVKFVEGLPLSDSRRILELGAGVGQFIKTVLRIPGFSPDRIVATDYISHSVNELRKLGVDAQLASVFELAAGPGNRTSFDAVCAFQSIEHMANVTELVVAVKGMLKPGGLAILSVPHGPSVEFNERYLNCFDWPPNHVGRWYRESFVALAASAHLELLAHEIEPRCPSQLLREAMVFYIHGVAASKPRSLAGRAQAIRNRAVRRILSAAVGSVVLLPLLPAIFRLDSGYSQLAVLRNPE
jgi:2-polyprenyl-3-methyl-5-hydroxy-6-metoxy-1,4-benzoquinol methylase